MLSSPKLQNAARPLVRHIDDTEDSATHTHPGCIWRRAVLARTVESGLTWVYPLGFSHVVVCVRFVGGRDVPVVLLGS